MSIDFEIDQVTKVVMVSKTGRPPVWAKRVEFTDKQIVRLYTGKEIRTIDYKGLGAKDQETIRQMLLELEWSGEGSFVWDGQEVAAKRRAAAAEKTERKLRMPVKDLTLIFYKFRDSEGKVHTGNGKKFGDLARMIDALRVEKESEVYWMGFPAAPVEEVEKVLIQK